MLKRRYSSKSKSLSSEKLRKKSTKAKNESTQCVSNKGKRKKQGEFESIFNAITDPIVVFDTEFNVIKINKAAQCFFAGNPVSKKCFFIKHKFALACKNCPTWQTLKTGIASNSEIVSPETEKPLLLKTYPIFNRRKRIKGVILIGRESSDILPATMLIRQKDL
ncbi:MAG: PAS domain-containing protein [Candidatus Brocadiaceae bacterium]|nr:PAS domain-containing protein [Candidatus Brocadiaceae bacterium]